MLNRIYHLKLPLIPGCLCSLDLLIFLFRSITVWSYFVHTPYFKEIDTKAKGLMWKLYLNKAKMTENASTKLSPYTKRQ